MMSSAIALAQPEIILRIVLAARTRSEDDKVVFRSLLLVSKAFYVVIRCNWAAIVEHYTYMSDSTRDSIYYFCGMIHREAVDSAGYDLPAMINADGTQRWYQYDRIHRDNDQPATIYV